MSEINVNGENRVVNSPQETPLLYVLRNELKVFSPKYGCGMAQCGSCSVLVDGVETRSCVTLASEAFGKQVTTLEGLPQRWANQIGAPAEAGANQLHPVQAAWIEEQTPLCGFCQSGMMIKATELLENNPAPSVDDIKEAYTTSGPSPHLCRCGSYKAIIEAVQRAAVLMQEGRDRNAG